MNIQTAFSVVMTVMTILAMAVLTRNLNLKRIYEYFLVILCIFIISFLLYNMWERFYITIE